MPPFNECPRYDTKQSDGETPVMLELWVMLNTLSLPSLPGRLRHGVVAPNRVLSMGKKELNFYLCSAELIEIELLIFIKMDLALDNLQW